jgi:protein TonB
MRFQLPDSKEWIETSGEVTWISESPREAGVRFVDLMEDTRAKIRNWISQEPLRPDTSQAQDAVRNAIAGSQPNTPGAVPEDKILKSIFADPGLFLVGSKSARAKPSVQPPPAVANELPQTASVAPVPERRSQPRRRVLSLEYLDLGDSNGGIILNLSEDGMYIQAVAGLSPDHISKLSFKIPDSGYLVETSGNIVWVGESRKDAGIQFDNLPEEARLKIREWVAEEFPARQNSGQPQQPSDPTPFAAKPAPDARKHDRLVEMPPGVALKSPPQSSGFPVTRIPDQKLEFVSTLPAAEVAPPSTQNSKDTSIDYVPPKQPESAAKVPLASVPPRVVQNPADVAANNVSPNQIDLSEKPSNSSANGTTTVIQETANGRPAAPAIQKPLPVAPSDANVISEKTFTPAALSGMQIQNRAAAKPSVPNVPFGSDPPNGLAPANDQKNVAREVPAAASDLGDWTITESSAVNPVPDRINNPEGAPSRIGAQATASSEIAARVSSSTAVSETPATTQSLNWKSLAAAILVVVLLSFAAGWIAAGPGGRKQILDKFVSRQADSSQPPENPGVTSAQTDAPVSGAGLPQTNVTTASPEQTINPVAATQPGSQTPPPQAAPQVTHAAIPSPPPASQTSRPPVASAGNVASSAPEKLADAKRVAAASSSPAPSATNSSSVNPSLAGQPQPTQPNAAAPSSNPPNSIAKSAPPPVPASASSPAPIAAVAEVVKGTVSVNASPFPSIRVPPELKSQISKQGASLQIGQLTSRVEPAYPEDAQHQRIEGVVKLRAIIARDGSVQDIDQMSGPPLLVAAAANAVRQWHYKPTSLDGQPVEATESITVTFRLQSARAN